MDLNFVFNSSDHLRYENGIHVSGPHGGAKRVVKVEPNIDGGNGYTVTIYNLDGTHPVWQNNIQMAPKQMKVIQKTTDAIVLRGFGYDGMGASFEDYGLTIHYSKGNVYKCTLHLYDRNVDVEYISEVDKSDFDPNNFILSDIIVTETKHGRLYTQSVLLHDHEIKISGKASKTSPGYIDFESCRPKELVPMNGSLINVIQVEEYFQDITNFFFVLAQIEADISNIPISFIKVCEHHIERSNRLIDQDIYTYCDEAIIVTELILNSSDPTFTMPNADKRTLWQQYKEIAFDTFREHIYLTKYQRTDTFGFSIKPYLVKLT